ncbi:MAG: glutathione peroxidase [Verrucomicrobia bacterium]|nr:glutathione peroxidase [Verrucomicrobiota bacterium]
MLWVLAPGALNCAPAAPAGGDVKVKTVHDVVVKDIEGRAVPLSGYKGKVLLIVNVASRCGFTPQYDGLQKLYERYMEAGLVVLGFPANNFMNQEPGSDAEILQFCTTQFCVTFPMFSKISVKGANIHPLYKFLTSEETNPGFAGAISWNFNKFLVGRDGAVVARFGSRDKPESSEVMQAVEKALSALPEP